MLGDSSSIECVYVWDEIHKAKILLMNSLEELLIEKYLSIFENYYIKVTEKISLITLYNHWLPSSVIIW